MDEIDLSVDLLHHQCIPGEYRRSPCHVLLLILGVKGEYIPTGEAKMAQDLIDFVV